MHAPPRHIGVAPQQAGILLTVYHGDFVPPPCQNRLTCHHFALKHFEHDTFEFRFVGPLLKEPQHSPDLSQSGLQVLNIGPQDCRIIYQPQCAHWPHS